MKQCTKCGASLSDNAGFCSVCGTKQPEQSANQYEANSNFTQQANSQQAYGQQTNSQQTYGQQAGNQQTYAQPNNNQPPKKTSKGVIAIIVAFAAVIIIGMAIFVGVTVFGGSNGSAGSSSMKTAVNDYYDAIASGNGDDLVNATCSKEVKKAMAKAYDCDVDELGSTFEEQLAYDEDTEIQIKNVKIESKEKADKDDVKTFVDSVKEETGVKIVMDEVYELEVSYSYRESSDDEWEDDSDSVEVYKANGKWYVLIN